MIHASISLDALYKNQFTYQTSNINDNHNDDDDDSNDDDGDDNNNDDDNDNGDDHYIIIDCQYYLSNSCISVSSPGGETTSQEQ